MTHLVERINIINFYESKLGPGKLKGGQLYFICPFHNENTPSFSVNIATGVWYCFGCGDSGNIVTFLMKFDNLTSTKEAYKALCEYANIPFNNTYTQNALEQYSVLKHLPVDYLTSLGIEDNLYEIIIPYLDENHNLVRYRRRNLKSAKTIWDNALNTATCLYGLWLLPTFKENFLILVEGESDTQTLLYNNFPCLGVPGANFFKLDWAKKLNSFEELYLFIEPDTSGKAFFKTMSLRLKEANYTGKVFTFSFKDYKDPSDAWCAIKDIDTFQEYIQEHLDAATEIDLKTGTEKSITFSPITLKPVYGFDVTHKGLFKVVKKENDYVLGSNLSSTPLIISSRIKDLETSLEQVEISYHLDNHWHTAILLRSELFNTRNIIKLADLGVNISTINAKEIVYYLQLLEASNRERLPIKRAINRFGWHNNVFTPFGDDNITIVNEDSELKNLWDAFSIKGDLSKHIEYIYSIINNHPLVRLCVMASLASPFFKDLGQRIMCIYIWASSKSGKTAALQLALSVWGNPIKLMKNFNATACGVEEMAHMLNNLPLGLNERQQRTHDKASQQLLETLLYMLAEGTGRTKSTKNGGVKQTTDWHNVILANGEIPLLSEHTHDGARNRCLEIHGKPFDDEETARTIYKQVENLHGCMGHKLVTQVLMSPDYAYIVDTLKKRIRELESMLTSEYPNKNNSHLALIATIITIDCYVTDNLFKSAYSLTQEEVLSLYKTVINMLPNILDYDLTESFYITVRDWLNSNRMHFETDSYTPSSKLLGLVEVSAAELSYFVYQEAFRELCHLKNVNPKQMLESFAQKGYIKTEKNNGKGRRTVRKTLHGIQQSFIQFDLNIIQQGDF